MRTFKQLMIVVAVALGAVAAAVPAHAHDARFSGFGGETTSVFPVPRDPWRSWGVRRELPEHFRSPRFRDDVVVVTPVPGPVWVQGQWVWDGFNWVWWPGHWQ